MGNLVTKINFKGKKGDTLHIPKPTRGTATAKAAETQVSLIAATEPEISITVDKHFEYSRMFEDKTTVQGLDSMRPFYADDAGYALARQVDWDLHTLGTGLQGGTFNTAAIGATTLTYDAAVIGGDGTTAWDPTAATNTGNGTTLTDAGIRKMIQTLDDADVPQDGRVLVIPPVERNTLMGLARFTEQAFTGEVGNSNTIRNGRIGNIYGVEVYVSNACPEIRATDTTTAYRVGMMFHKDAFAYVEQMGVRAQTQYKQEYLGDLVTSDTLYGIGELRDTSGVAFVVPK